jgi:hypothetical protein
MSVQVNPPPILKIPSRFLNDPEVRAFFEQQRQILFQLWNRTGGGTDNVTLYSNHTQLSNIGTNTHVQIDAHLALVNQHIDWTASGAGTIDASNYVDNDTTDHTALSNIGTNTHAQIDTHIASTDLHLTLSNTTDLEDQSATINTTGKVFGKAVKNTTTGVLVFASGTGATAVWHYYDETTAHTPV